MQDVFARYSAQRRVREPISIALLYRAVRHRAMNRMRNDRVRTRETGRYATQLRTSAHLAHNDGERALLATEVEHWLEVLVAQLPAKQRDAFRLVRLYGVPLVEAAPLLGVQVSTVTTHVMRATRALAIELDGLGLLDGQVRTAVGKAPRHL